MRTKLKPAVDKIIVKFNVENFKYIDSCCDYLYRYKLGHQYRKVRSNYCNYSVINSYPYLSINVNLRIPDVA